MDGENLGSSDYEALKAAARKKYKLEPEKSRAMCAFYNAQYNFDLFESSVKVGGLKGLVDEEDFDAAKARMDNVFRPVLSKIEDK